MERMPDFARRMEPRRAERAQEFERLREAIERIIGAPVGDPKAPLTQEGRLHQLELILETEPQRDRAGRLRYLVTSGLAVEMITGFERSHHDIDLVIMDPEDGNRWSLLGTDNVTPGRYWADMKFEPIYLEETARATRTRKEGKAPVVEVVHPAIIMVQKSSNAFGRPPRTKDNEDVSAIVRHWKEKEGYTKTWNPIVRQSLDALPRSQIDTTLGRIRKTIG